ncbi:MAG TPA: hypothetical protein VK157_15450, partial [Phycisphaerales bacterium]|nr:hypothetical protein [Phycisphaerales bacterium]
MAKYNIDDILSELGVDGVKDAGDGKGPAAKKHRIDENENSFSPLPSMPANQRAYGQQNATPTNETSITKRGSAESGVGPAMAEIYRPDAGEDPDKVRELGELLLVRNVVTADKLAQANQIIKSSPGRRLSEIILEQGADEAQVMQALAQVSHLNFERIDLSKGLDGGFDGKMLQRLTPEFCKQNQVIPLRQDGTRVVVALTQPDNVYLIDTVKEKLGVAGIKLVLTTALDIRGALEMVGGGAQQTDNNVGELLAEVQEGDVQVEEKKETDESSLEKEAKESPVIRYVNHIIQLGLQQGASDIHIEPSEKKLKVRFRIDGELYEVLNPPVSMG